MAENAKIVARVILEEPSKAPLLLRRCIYDVMLKPQLMGRNLQEKFEGAVAISLASLEHAGDLVPGSLKETPLGRSRSTLSKGKPDYRAKEAAFAKLVEEVGLQVGVSPRQGQPQGKPAKPGEKPEAPVRKTYPTRAGFGRPYGPSGLEGAKRIGSRAPKNPGGGPASGPPGTAGRGK